MNLFLINVLTTCILVKKISSLSVSSIPTFQSFLRVGSRRSGARDDARVHSVENISIPSRLFSSTKPTSTETDGTSISSDGGEGVDDDTYTVQITHQNSTTSFQIFPGESILAALERLKMHDELSLPSLPHECRRGHCLTCSGRHISSSQIHNVQLENDGLSPAMKNTIRDKNLVLTCSSYVKGEGVKLELGVNDDAWKSIWSGMNYDDEEGEQIRADAVAKAMRLADERNLERWAKKTETMLFKDDDDDEGKGENHMK